MSNFMTIIGGGFAFALFPLFFILLNRTLKHAIDYERVNQKKLSQQIKYVWNKLCQNDKKLILTTFSVSWILFSIIILAVAGDSAWVGELVKIIDKFGDLLMKVEN